MSRGNWSNGFVPVSVDANLTPANATTTNNFAVTFHDGDSYTIFSLEAPAYATIEVTGGSLTVSNGMSFAGNVEMIGGTIELQNNISEIDGVFDNSGGTVTIDANAQLNLDGGSNNLGGTIAGAGTLDVAIGTFSLSSSIDMQVANWIVDYRATVDLTADLSYGGTFTENDALNLDGNTLTLSGNATLSGQVNGSGSGTDAVVVSGSGAADISGLTLDRELLARKKARSASPTTSPYCGSTQTRPTRSMAVTPAILSCHRCSSLMSVFTTPGHWFFPTLPARIRSIHRSKIQARSRLLRRTQFSSREPRSPTTVR
jgi:hypothetical protein